MSTSFPIRVASIGAGRRGRLCKLAHQPEQGATLVAACDLRQEVRDEYQAEFGPDFFTTDDYREMLARNDIDAVFVTSPDFLHEEHALACLESGRSIYIEKPLAITIEGCDRIIQAAESNGVKLYVGHNLRFANVFATMKQLIDEGRIGEVQAIWCRHFISYGGDAYFRDWHSERRNTTSLLLQKAAHDLDVIHWLGGAYTERVVGMGKLSVYDRTARREGPSLPESLFYPENWPPLEQTGLSPIIDVEDHSMLLMQMTNGIQASYTQCHYTPDSSRNYTVIGTEGRLENIGDHSTPEHQATIRIWNTRRDGYSERGQEEITVPFMDGDHGGSDPLIVNGFLHYLRTGERSGASPWDARMSVATGCLATESLRNHNQPFDVPQTPVQI